MPTCAKTRIVSVDSLAWNYGRDIRKSRNPSCSLVAGLLPGMERNRGCARILIVCLLQLPVDVRRCGLRTELFVIGLSKLKLRRLILAIISCC
jgi:hypothetical protein